MIPEQNETREIRVFISSTFADMEAEREHLNKKVFPKLRKLCQQRSVIFTEVDLQWGITEEQAKDGAAIEMCLDEINRCHPYFIGLIGERYGWAPKDDGLLDVPVRDGALKKKVSSWAEAGESVTAMEIMHGVLDDPKEAPFAYFYFRQKALTEKLSQGGEATVYYEADTTKQQKLSELKERIEANLGGWHVHSGEQAYGDVEALGEKVEEDLLAVINQEYPEDEQISTMQLERNMHAAFAQSRRSTHREGEPSSYIANEQAFTNIFQHMDSFSCPVVVTGSMGSGKSALLVHAADRWREKHKKHEYFVIEHYAGSGGESDDVGVLLRVMSEIKTRFAIGDDLPKEHDDVYQDFASWLMRVPKNTPFLLVLDGVNQFVSNQGTLKRFMQALPAKLGNHMHIILSTLPGEVLDVVEQLAWSIEKVEPFSVEQRRQLVRAYLAHLRKELSDDLLDSLVQNNSSQNPLYLRVILDELRVDAKHDELELKLQHYLQAENPQDLFSLVLQRWEQDYGEVLVHDVLGLIASSRYGLSESELRSILWPSLYMEGEAFENTSDQNPRQLSTFIYGMGAYLADRDGLYGFMHDALRLAVEAEDLNWFDDDFKQGCRQRIVDYFEGEEVSHRQIDELPWQLVMLENYSQLRTFLESFKVFDTFTLRHGWFLELFQYWRKSGAIASTVSNKYLEQLEGYDGLDIAHKYLWVAFYFQFIGEYAESDLLLDKMDKVTKEPILKLKGVRLRAFNMEHYGEYFKAESLLKNTLLEFIISLDGDDKQLGDEIIGLGKGLVTSTINRVYKEEGQGKRKLVSDIGDAERILKGLVDTFQVSLDSISQEMAELSLAEGYVLHREETVRLLEKGGITGVNFSRAERKLLEAMEYANQSLFLKKKRYGEGSLDIVSALKILANVYLTSASTTLGVNPKESYEYSCKAEMIFKQVLQIRSENLGDDYSDKCWDLRDLAKSIVTEGLSLVVTKEDYALAIIKFNQSISQYREVLGLLSLTHSRRGEVKQDAINAFLEAGQAILEAEYMEEAILLLQNTLLLEDENELGWVGLQNKIGSVLLEYGAKLLNDSPSVAIDLFIAVEQIHLKTMSILDGGFSMNPEFLKQRENLQSVFSESALQMSSKSNLIVARELFQKAISISANSDLTRENSRNLAVILVQEGQCYVKEGDIPRAIENLSEASKMFAEQKEEEGSFRMMSEQRFKETIRLWAKLLFESGDRAGALKLLLENKLVEL